MKKVQLSKEFYKRLYEVALDYAQSNFRGEFSDPEDDAVVDLSLMVDDYEVELQAKLKLCWQPDDSFDESYYVDVEDIVELKNVYVYLGDDELEFDYDAYEEQFIEHKWLGIKAGDKIVFNSGNVYEFNYHNKRTKIINCTYIDEKDGKEKKTNISDRYSCYKVA